MKILITGAKGMIGSALTLRLVQAGHHIASLGRGADSDFQWDPEKGIFPVDALEGVDAVVHLAGETIKKRWTAAQKVKIRASRIAGTALLAKAMALLPKPPRILIAASAVGYYGDQGERELTEYSEAGQGFLAELCRDWEAACRPAVEAGIRVVNARMSIILSPVHGVLAEMLPAFQFGLGGVIGTGRQFLGWVSLQDTVRAFDYLLKDNSLEGPVNVTSPNPVRMTRWAKSLGRALARPAFLKTPTLLLRALFGEVVDHLLIASQNVLPAKLLAAGFKFNDADFEPAVRAVLTVEVAAAN